MLREAGGPLVSTGAQPGPPIPSPPSSIQSHHACGHQGFRQKEACNGRGSLITKLPGCCQPGALPHRTDARQVAVYQARACLGLTGGPVGRQSQLPRKVPLNFPCCLQPAPASAASLASAKAPSACTGAGSLPAVSSDMSRATGSRSLVSCPHWLQGCLLWLLARGFPLAPLQTPQDP